MAVDTSAVQIVINVVDGNSGEVVAKVSQSLGQLGAAGATTGSRMKQGMEEAGTGAQTAREKVHLLTEEFGIRLPRAFRGIIAESKLAQAALNAVGTGLIAFGAIQIGVMVFTQIYEGVKKVYEKWFDTTKAVKEYELEAGKAASQKLFDSSSFESTLSFLRQANQEVAALSAKKSASDSTSWIDRIFLPHSSAPRFNAKDDQSLGAALEVQEKTATRDLEQSHELTKREIEDNAALRKIGVGAWGAISVERRKDIQLAQEQLKYTQAQEQALYQASVRAHKADPKKFPTVYKPDVNAGQTEYNDAIERSKIESRSKSSELLQTEKAEITQMYWEATEAGLQDDYLLQTRRNASLDQLQIKYAQGHISQKAMIQEQGYLNERFDKEHQLALEKQTEEVQKHERESMAAGLTGIPKIEATAAAQIAGVKDKSYYDVDGTGHSALAERERQSYRQSTNAEITAAQEEFTRHIDALADESSTHQIAGFERINAEAKKQIDDLRREYEKLYGKNVSDPRYQAHLGELNKGVGLISSTASQETSKLSQHNSDETAQLEAEARAKWLSAEKQQSAAIETEYEERLRKYKELQVNKEISDDDYNRRALAAEQLKNAQLVEASKAAREKMAGEFSRFFKDPMGSLKEMGDKAAGEAAAAMVQRVQNHFGGAGASASAPGGEGGIFGGLFDRIAGAPKNGAAGAAAKAGTVMPGAVAASKLSVGTAQISIGSANVTFGAGGAPGAMGLSSGSRDAGSSIGFSAPSGAATVSSTFGGGGVAPGAMGLPSGSRDAGSPLSFNAPSGTGTESRTLSSSSTGAAGGYGTSGSTVGGAGDPGSVGTMPVGFTGTPGSAPAPSNTLGTALGNVQKAYSFSKQAKSIFGNKNNSSGETAHVQHDALPGTLNADGSFTSAGGTSKMSRVEGAAQGAMGLYSAYEGNGGVGGALSGAMSGAQLGNSVAGPWGAAVGAAAGTVLGAIGFGGREKARVYDLKQVRPQIANDTSSYQQGSMDYLTAYSDMQSLDSEAKKTTNSYGPAARSYYQDTIKKEIHQAEAKFTSQQKAGRSNFTATAAQYDRGGTIDNFGTLGTTSEHGFIHAKQGEYMVEQQAANTHAGALNAINSGATHSDMAKYYGGDSGTMPAQTQSAGDVHLHLSAIDGKSSMQFLSANKHNIRKVLNDSYGENSGGADA